MFAQLVNSRSRRSIIAALLCSAGLAILGPWSGALAQSVQLPNEQKAAQRLGISVQSVRQLSAQRGMNEAALEALPVERVPRALLKLQYGDIQHKRMEFRVLQEQNEDGVIPPNARVKAIQDTNALRAKALPNQRKAGVPAGARVNVMRLLPPQAGLQPGGAGWVALGPGNIGGRIRSIVVHPTQPNVMWAGSVGGGLWRTNNAGGQWQPVDDFMANLAVTSLVMQPTDHNVMFAGTGEGFFNLDALRGAGVFRSMNGGADWHQLPSTTSSQFHYVNRLAMSPDGQILLAATRSGIFRTIDQGQTAWIHQSTLEMGDVDFHPSESTKAIAGGLSDGTAYYSDDGGVSWTAATHTGFWSGRVEVTYSLKDPSIVYASVNQNGGEVWRSSDGGKTFSPRSQGVAYLGNQGWYDNIIWAGDPSDANLVIVGGVDLWRSTNGGQSLQRISQWWSAPDSAHADHHVIVAHPNYNGTSNRMAFFGNDGGVYKAADVKNVQLTNGWQELNNNLAVSQLYGAAINPNTGVIIAGLQDNGSLTLQATEGSEDWKEMFGGDGGYCAADPADNKFFYGEYVFINIHRSMDGGKTSDFISGNFWNGQDWTWKDEPFTIPDARDSNANFIAPFVLDPNKPERLLAGGLSLWRTNDARAASTDTSGPTWKQIKQPIGTNKRQHSISAIAVAAGNSDIVYVGHNNGDVWRTQNGNADSPTWTQVDAGLNQLPNRFCHRIVIDRSDHKRAFATFGGYAKSNVWVTTNSGATWTDLGATLPEAPVRSLALHPDNPNFVYLGTEVGVFASEDGGNTWSPTNEGPTNCSVDELFWRNKELYAATHGRGLFRINLEQP
jgi:photosystem II stability/assembly factor-like uncharacterized protein